MKFINLRNYSENSLLKAAIKVKDLVKRASEVWLKSIALSDTTAYWMVDFFASCKEAWIKPLYWFNIKYQWWLHNILAYPTSEQWKINLFNIVTDKNIEKADGLSFYRDKLEKINDILFIVDFKTFEKFPEYYKFLPEDRFYVELQPRNTIEEFERLKSMVDISKIIITSPVYYLDEIYVQKFETFINNLWEEEKREVFKMTWNEIIKILKSIETWEEIANLQEDFPNLYFKNDEQIRENFSYISDEEFELILQNINKISGDIHFELQLWVPQIPVFEIEGEARKIFDENKNKSPCLSSDEWYLRYLNYTNLDYRFDIKLSFEEIIELIHKEFDPDLWKTLPECSIEFLKEKSKEHWSEKKKEIYEKLDQKWKIIIDRSEYELLVMHKMWFDAYFLIVADYINFARDNWDLVWPWRWSAAWSLVAFLTWITDIDPLKFDLLFERFLNPSRISMPDIDTDFSNRDAVIFYCAKKYGAEHVTPVITYMKLTSKTALKGVWKAIWIPFWELNRLTNKITNKETTWHLSLDAIYEQNAEFREAIDSANEYKNLFDTAKPISWLKQWTWQHACAVIIAPKPVTNFCPLQYPTDKKWVIKQKDRMITQLEWWDLEAQWLLKMDFLWLQNLTIMNDCINIVKKEKWIDINISKLDLDDQKVYEKIFQPWNTTNVFQFESSWMKKYLKWLKPNNLDDLIAMVSLYRPWPIKFIDTYINRKHGIEPLVYQVPILEKSMKKTYWICVYQEQIMQMAQDLAGYTLWEADILRRAIWKKKKKVILEQREIFVNKAVELWYVSETVWQIYDDMILPAAEYSFNKSHAACYAYIAYQWAYLKTYYPAAYNVAVLMSQWDDLERTAIAIEDILISWISVNKLDINTSEVEYKYISDTKVALWLKLIKWVWPSDLQKVVDERDKNWKYITFDDFVQRNKKILNKKILSWLLLSWALDGLIEQNKWILNMDRILNFVKKEKKSPTNQVNLFSLFDNLDSDDNSNSQLIDFEEPKQESNPMSRSINEMASTGVMLRNHPFDGIKSFIEDFELNRKTLHWNKNSALLKNEELEVRGVWIIIDLMLTKTSAWKTMTKLKLLWTDYYISGMINAELTHKYEYELIWTSRDKPSWIYKMIEYTGKFSINEYWRSLFITDLKFKDINQAYNVAKNQSKYNESDKCSWKDIYLYKNEVLDYKKAASILISEYLLKPENANDYNEKIKDLKEFLLKHHSPAWEYEILLKTYDWRVKETWLCITNKDVLINYIEKTWWLKVVWIKRSSES